MSPAKRTPVIAFFSVLCILSILAIKPVLAQTGDQRINDDSGIAGQFDPAIATNSFGQTVVVWQDQRDGTPNIYAQMFTHRGFANKKNFKVNDDGTMGLAADVAINRLGYYVIVWESRSDSARIYAQKFANNGVRIGGPVRVDARARGITVPPAEPAVGIDREGGFAVSWCDLSTENAGIYLRHFDEEGQGRGAIVRVNTVTSMIQGDHTMAMNEFGDLVVAWSDDRLSSGGPMVVEIFAQVFSRWGARIGGEFQVSHSPVNVFALDATAAMQPDREFMICWRTEQAAPRIYASSFDADGLALSKQVALSDTLHATSNSSPDICTMLETSYAVAWRAESHGEIVLRYIDRVGILGPEPVSISDIPGEEKKPSLAYSEVGFTAVFEDNVNGNSDIYGVRRGSDVPLNVYAASGFQRMVPITWDANWGRSDISAYRIARREGSNPYADIAVVDLSTRGILGASMRDWIDTTVVADHTYSYIIYGLSGTTPAPSVPVVATPKAERPRIGATWAYDIPVIDGLLGPGEWADAEKVTLGNPYAPSPVILFVKYRRETTGQWLYLAVDDPNDKVIDPANGLGMLFDLNSDGKWDAAGPSKEGMISITPSGATFTGFWGKYPNALGADAVKKANGVMSSISTTAGNVQYEVAIDLATSPLKITGSGARMAFWVTDPGNFYPTHYGNAGEWPLGALWECAAPLGNVSLLISAVPVSALDWPMSRKSPDQSAWAYAEHTLKPPFGYTQEYGTDLGVFREMAVLQDMLFATAKDLWTVEQPWKLHVFQVSTGDRLWSYTLPNSWTWAATHPAVNDSLVLVGDGGSSTLYALGRRTGHLRWQKNLPRLGKQDPILDGSRLYIVTDSLYCLEVLTGRTLWHAEAGYSVAGILAADQTNLFYADGTHLGCWDKMTGTRQWLIDNEGQPSVVVDDTQLYTFTNESFYFRRKSDGAFRWGTNCTFTPYPEESNVLAATDSFTLVREPGYSDDMDMWLVNKADCHFAWGRDHDSTYIGPPVIANSIVYYRSWDERPGTPIGMRSSLTALDLWTGETVATIYDSAFSADPIIADGKLFIGANRSIRAYSNKKITGLLAHRPVIVQDHTLISNYPNPFNPSTTIRFALERPGRVTLRIYNAAGQCVRTLLEEVMTAAGVQELRWDGRSDTGRVMASGVYIVRLEMAGRDRSMKILLLK
jgi:hypothetical protein